MVNVNKVLGLMAENHKTRGDVAKELGIAPKTFSAKLKKGVFNSNEMEILISLLNIEDPVAVFFTDKVTQNATMQEIV